MLTPKKLLGSAILCAVLTAPTQASAPDEGTSTNSTTWDIRVSNAAKIANQGTSLMSLPIWPLQQLSQIFVENDAADAILALGLTSSHLTGSLLGWNYPDPCQDEDTRINNPTIQQAIRVELRKAINARAEELATRQKEPEAQSKDQPKPEPKARLLAPWQELLGEKARLPHLIWALKMLQPQNVARLGKEGLLGQLSEMTDKTKALALGASAAEIFTKEMGVSSQSRIIAAALASSWLLSEYEALSAACKEHFLTDKMDWYFQSRIIAAALASSWPLSEYAALSAACKQHLFTEKMDGFDQAMIIEAALASSRPLSEYEALSAACKEHLFTEDLSGWARAKIISSILPLSDAQMAQLVRECAVRPHDDAFNRKEFIDARTKELREGK